MPKLGWRFVVIVALSILVGPDVVAAKPSYGEDVDAYCSAQGRGTPYASSAGQGFLSECSLCHDFTYPPELPDGGNDFDPPASQYKNNRSTGNFSWFCPAATVNQLPTITPIADRSVNAGQMVVIDVSASDPDGDPLVLTVSNGPASGSFVDRGNGTGTFTWTPGAADLGTRTVTFLAHDDATPPGQAMEPVAITVGSSNRPPVLGAIGNRTGEAGMPLTIDVSATDPDGGALVLTAATLPGGAVFTDNRNGTGRLAWTPTASQLGNHNVTFRVTDAGTPAASDSEAVTLTIGGAVNAPPVLGAIGNRTTQVGQALHVAISATDADGDALAFSATGLPAGATLTGSGNGAASLDWTPGAGDTGSHPVTVTVRDDGSPQESDSEAFQLVVQVVAPPPTGALRIDEARWESEDEGAALELRGSGANPGEMVAVLDADTGAVLGSRRAWRNGSFRFEIHPALVPCAVQAQTGQVRSEAVGVAGATADCGEALMTQVHAKWECAEEDDDELEDAALRVRGAPVPLGASIEVSDASSGAVLGAVQADPNGRFRLRVPIAIAPNAVEVLVSSGGQAWTLGPVPVAVECEDDDDEDEGRRGGRSSSSGRGQGSGSGMRGGSRERD